MTALELDKALSKLYFALKSDTKNYHFESYFSKSFGKIVCKRYLVKQERIFQYDIPKSDSIVEVHLFKGRMFENDRFDILPKQNSQRIANSVLFKNSDYKAVKSLFYNEITIDEFLDYFEIDRKIFDKGQK